MRWSVWCRGKNIGRTSHHRSSSRLAHGSTTGPGPSPGRVRLPLYGSRVGLRNDLFEACSAFTRITACRLSLSPYFVTRLTEGFNRFVTSTIAPIASGRVEFPDSADSKAV